MTFGLVHASYSLPECQALKLTFFAPCPQERVSDVRGKVDKTRQVLEGEIQRRQQLKKDLETIRVWVVKIEVVINSKLAKHEEMDEREIKVQKVVVG